MKNAANNPAGASGLSPAPGVKTDLTSKAAHWFKDLQYRICTIFESIENEYRAAHADSFLRMAAAESCPSAPPFSRSKPHFPPAGKFDFKPWSREDDVSANRQLAGEGITALMHGQVFEKVGVNYSCVRGRFSEKFRQEIPGAVEAGGNFWAAGISLVAHMRSPLVPAVHMNTRHIVTSRGWFGGGADITPALPALNQQEIKDFHGAFRKVCDKHDPGYYPRFSKWCDDYFYMPHRGEARGAGGIFYDYLQDNPEADFVFTKEVGECFARIYPEIVRRMMHKDWNKEQREELLVKRGRYVEFNLLYDRGTRFGLETGGNTEAILMSLPPEVKWP